MYREDELEVQITVAHVSVVRRNWNDVDYDDFYILSNEFL